MLAPPSTKSVCPVMKLAASDRRKQAAAAISAGVPSRFIGTLARWRASPALPGGLVAT